MKKSVFIILIALFIPTFILAQNGQITSGGHTNEGKFVIDVNTTLGSIAGMGIGGAGTSFLLTTAEGSTIWNIGAEVGYFVADDLAIKVGLGYGDFDGGTFVSYKLGAKYYVANRIPIQIDFSGQGGNLYDSEKPSYLGLQAGYAFFIGDMVSLEPSLRYSLSLNSDYYENFFQIQMGFSIFL